MLAIIARALALTGLAAISLPPHTASAGSIFSDDFESDAASFPTAPATLNAGWVFDPTISGGAGNNTTVLNPFAIDDNEHAIVDAFGTSQSNYNSRGWITSFSNAFIYIDLGVAQQGIYDVSFVAGAMSNQSNATIDYRAALVLGQSFDPNLDVAELTGTDNRDLVGKSNDIRTFSYVSGDNPSNDHLFLQIGRTGGLGSTFMFVDDVNVSFVPSPTAGAGILIGLSGLMLRRRKSI